MQVATSAALVAAFLKRRIRLSVLEIEKLFQAFHGSFQTEVLGRAGSGVGGICDSERLFGTALMAASN